MLVFFLNEVVKFQVLVSLVEFQEGLCNEENRRSWGKKSHGGVHVHVSAGIPNFNTL